MRWNVLVLLLTAVFCTANAAGGPPQFIPCHMAKLLSFDGAAGDFFGQAVSIFGDTAIVGAHVDDAPAVDSGSASVFVRAGGTWVQQAKLTAPDAAAGDRFGSSVAISGNTAVVGAIWNDDAGDSSGSAYVFVRAGNIWFLQAKLVASDADGGDLFGWTVAIDGDTIVVGAPGADDDGMNSGSAYVFKRTGLVWSQQAKLTASDGAAGDQFGYSVSLSVNTAIVGANASDSGAANGGAAYLFNRTGNAWAEGQKLTAYDIASGDLFGTAVAISGNILVVGAYSDDHVGTDSGSVHVFQRFGADWELASIVAGSETDANDHFGASVAIIGSTFIAGAFAEEENGFFAGAAYLFEGFVYPEVAGGGWYEFARLAPPDGDPFDQFGWSVSITNEYAIVGSLSDDDIASGAGAAYIYAADQTDCNHNGYPDVCDIGDGTSSDRNGDGIPDECDALGDDDNDGVVNGEDLCPNTPEDATVNSDGCDCSQLDCSDGDPCTIDNCFLGNCSHGQTNCFDTDPCTIDYCINGECVHEAFDCDDEDDCTIDECFFFKGESDCCVIHPGLGCNDEVCETIVCAIDPFCCSTAWDSICANEAEEFCQDCNALIGACSYTNIRCVDDDPCTLDICVNGGCEFPPKSCADGDDCTFDSCDPKSGCTHDVIDCDDKDPCTIDSCIDGGCDYSPLCEDGDPCTEDFCKGGDCFTGEPLPDTDGDGVCDLYDGCPFDPYKLDPGACGCGFSDDDVDRNGTPDCLEVRCEVTKLLADDGELSDHFGWSVAISGNTAVVGSNADDELGTDVGSVYVFVREAGLWQFQQKLTADDGSDGDMFGTAVAIDGDTLLIAAPFDVDNVREESGAVDVFTRSNGVWSQQQKITPSRGKTGDEFGSSVSLFEDSALISAKGDDTLADNAGAVYVYVRSIGGGTAGAAQTFELQQKLFAEDGDEGDTFGSSVSLFANSECIGAPLDDFVEMDEGSAYLFTRVDGVWTQKQKIVALDPQQDDRLGASCAIHNDTVIAGAFREDDAGEEAGAAYVFLRQDGVWTQQQKLTASDAEIADEFGSAVAVRGDVAVVGTPHDGDLGGNSGSAYIFTRTAGVWTEDAKVTASDGNESDLFGFSIALSDDAAIIGSWHDDTPDDAKGSAFIFSTTFVDCNNNGVSDACDISSGEFPDLDNNGIPDVCEEPPPPACLGDLNRDQTVDGADLGLLLGAWDTADVVADLTGDGLVDGADLGLLLGSWGACPPVDP